jgi:hypothetical protein
MVLIITLLPQMELTSRQRSYGDSFLLWQD